MEGRVKSFLEEVLFNLQTRVTVIYRYVGWVARSGGALGARRGIRRARMGSRALTLTRHEGVCARGFWSNCFGSQAIAARTVVCYLAWKKARCVPSAKSPVRMTPGSLAPLRACSYSASARNENGRVLYLSCV